MIYTDSFKAKMVQRLSAPNEREVIVGLVNDAVAAGARRERACLQVGLAERSMQRWRRADVGDDRRAGPRTV